MDEEFAEDIFNYNYTNVRINKNPRPQQKGYYIKDWKGFFLHLGEVHAHGYPSSHGYLVTLCDIYNVPFPINRKKK